MTTASPPAPRTLVQFSLQSLMVVMAIIAVILAVYRQAGWRPLAYYYFMLFIVGPWFAYLLAECLPIRARPLRMLLGNLVLMAMFLGAVRLAELFVGSLAIVAVGLAGLALWTPQYMVFFVMKQKLEE